MAIPQRDDPPTPSSFAAATEDKWLRRTGTIEAIKRRVAEKKAAEEKKKSEARARAAYRRKQRKFEENGLLEGFAQINWSFMAARDELKRRGFSLELMHKLKGDVVARISPWNIQHHADYVEYFIYQYYLSCSEVQIETLPADQQEPARKEWAKVLRPFKRSPEGPHWWSRSGGVVMAMQQKNNAITRSTY